MPRSPLYSLAHISKAKTCVSRSLGPSAWQACRNSWAIVPWGVRPSSLAYMTFDVPVKMPPRRSFMLRRTFFCQALEKRRLVP